MGRKDVWLAIKTAAIAAAAITSGVGAVQAADEPAKFPQVTLILGSPPGGGYDNYARPFARHFGNHLPGKPGVVVQNMPGGGGLLAAGYIYNKAPKDGTVIGMLSAASVFEPLFGNQQAQFDTPQFTWVGNMDEIIGTCAVWNTSGIESFNDLITKQTIFGGAGAGSANVQMTNALRNLVGAKIQLVSGYPGATEVNLAMHRGEVAGTCGISLAALKSVYQTDWKSGALRPIVQLGSGKHPELAQVASIYDFAKTQEERAVFDLVFGRYVLGRPLLSAPGVPADRTLALRAAFMETLTDPAFLADAEHARIDVNPSSGEAVEETVRRFFKYPPAVVAKAVAAMQ